MIELKDPNTSPGTEGRITYDEFKLGTRAADKFTVVSKSLTNNVAKLTLAGPHSLKVNESIVVSLSPADPNFDGIYAIVAVTADTISYAKVAANVATTATSGQMLTVGVSLNERADDCQQIGHW